MDYSELNSVAYHEAGHIVIADSLDCRLDGLEVYWRSDIGRWFGISPIGLVKQNIDVLQVLIQEASLALNGAKVAVAGMLAQTKFQATQQVGKEVQFDASSDLNEMMVFLRDNRRTEESPGSFVVSFLTAASNERKSIEFAGFCFSTVDSKCFNKYLSHAECSDPETLVRETMQMLDNESTWAKVKLLASLVLSQPSEGEEKRRSLTADQLLEALTTFGRQR